MIKEIKNNDLTAVKSAPAAVIDFNATWCGPCRMLAPVLEQLSDEMQGVEFFACDVDENSNAAAEFGIMSIPAVGVFKDGRLIEMTIGFKPKEQMKSLIEKALK